MTTLELWMVEIEEEAKKLNDLVEKIEKDMEELKQTREERGF